MKKLHQIKASAGSGKTYALIQNFLAALNRCNDNTVPHHAPGCILFPEKLPETFGSILAITFTNAAASEMRDKVLKRLKLCALGLEKDVDTKIAEKWLDIILHDMDNLNIRTIDSLLHAIVRSAALDLEIYPDFELVFESRDVIMPYLDLYLAKATEKNDKAHARIRAACLSSIEFWENKNFIAGSDFLDKIFKFINGALKDKFLNLADKSIIEKTYRKICSGAALAAQRLLTILEKCPDYELDKNTRTYLENFAENNFSNDDLKHLKHINKFIENYPDPESGIHEAFCALAQARESLDPDYFYLKEALRFAPLVEIANDLACAYKTNMNIETLFPSILLPSLTKKALGAENGVSDAICRLGNRLTHFLMDEFQDTSRAQWESLRPLVQNALASNGSLTWVGDIKQSIYGWRDADPALFNEIIDDLQQTNSEDDILSENLPHNWRSLPEIVYFNNRLFAPLGNRAFAEQFLKKSIPAIKNSQVLEEAIERLSSSFANTVQSLPKSAPENGGYVVLKQIAGGSNSAPSLEFLDEIAKTVINIHKRRSYADILILCRSVKQATFAAQTLISRGIPVITENSLKLSSHPLISEIIAFLQFLNNTEDDVAFWTILSGSILQDYSGANIPNAEELLNWAAKPRNRCLAKQFQHDFFPVWQKIFYPFERQAGLFTTYDTVREWLKFFNTEKRYPESASFIRSLLELIYSAELRGHDSIPSFLSWWEEKGIDEKTAMPEKTDAVRIMTIHHAKGLEAPVVLVPWTNYKSVANDFSPAIIERCGMRLAIPIRKYWGDDYYKKISTQLAENVDLLYVAFTRAKEELYVFAPEYKGNSKPLLIKLLEEAGISVPQEFGLPPSIENPPPLEKNTAEAEASYPVSAEGGFHPALPAEKDRNLMAWSPELDVFRDPLNFDIFRSDNRGTFLHYCLENMLIAETPAASAKNALEFGLLHSGIAVPDTPETRQELYDALYWFATLPQSSHWLQDGRHEQAIMDCDGKLMRVDNLVEEKWGILVLDYKSGEIKPEHVRQMRDYISCLKASDTGNRVIRAVLIYVDQKLFRLVDFDVDHEPVSAFPLS